LLEGRGSAEVLAARTALPREGRCAVLAVRALAGPGDEEAGGRLPGLSALHCAAQGHQVVVVPAGRDVLVLSGGLAKDPEQAAGQVSRLGESLARQLSSALGSDVRIGLGEVRDRLDQAPDSRRTADLALRAMLFSGSPRASARLDELAEAVAMLQVLDALGELALPPDTPVARLAAYDARHRGGALVATLRAYLDHFGDVPAASRSLNVHANTFRYRLRRLREVCGIDLDAPDARLLAQLQLRLMSREADGDLEAGGS
ncbi:PucR family transcriptional regulator, partial [Streptomyces palmae]